VISITRWRKIRSGHKQTPRPALLRDSERDGQTYSCVSLQNLLQNSLVARDPLFAEP